MQTIEMNKKAVLVLEDWDPFNVGRKAYAVEIADVVSELHIYDHPTDLAKRIRDIYEHSYATWIPIEKCMQIAYKLLAIKYEAKSIV
ncbi:DUF1871 family protein [Sporosarcina oncorhynchi]|uniref:DUF1871 family protein n=1 Tax=Sporosarcina oncorhynchi TaxID=3056444 RepID=A0ABZ0L2J4_9BACL|nr:DUF1871 family protein [Sporosarcina sp. T2O-4]WOV86402.1 DUF1871 family protein [Sporosarcina sp. T2O-4]